MKYQFKFVDYEGYTVIIPRTWSAVQWMKENMKWTKKQERYNNSIAVSNKYAAKIYSILK